MRYFIIISIFGLLSVFESNLLYAQFNNDFHQGTIKPITDNLPKPQSTQRLSSPKAATTPSRSTPTTKTTKSNKPLHTEAVLFARDNYEKFTNLSGTNNDAHLLITGFLKKSGTKNSQISVLCDRPDKFNDINTAKNKLKIQDPTRENLINELKRVAKIPCDRLVIAIACHGASAYGKSYIISQGGAEENKIFSKVSPNDIIPEIKKQNLVALEEIRDILQNAKASQVLLLLDACRSITEVDSKDSSRSTVSGSGVQNNNSFMREFNDRLKSKQSVTKSASNTNDQQPSSKTSNIAIITSCSMGQGAKEDPTGNGFFTRAFVEGLEGEADCLGCLDGNVTLTEAYNYAFSKISQHQTPEIFHDSNFENFDLLEYEIAEPSTEDRDLDFLLKSASIFLDNTPPRENNKQKQKQKEEEHKAGVAAINCVLENIPNNKLAYSLRGNGNRMLKNYEQSIEDFSTVGQKFQLYAKADPKKPLALKQGNNKLDVKIKDKDILTITQINDNWLLVTEINNIPLEDQGYINKANVTWNPKDAENRIVGTDLQAARTVRAPSSRDHYSSGGMVSPGEGNVSSGGGGAQVTGSRTGFGI